MQQIFDIFIHCLSAFCNNEIFIYIVCIYLVLGIFSFLFYLGRF